jgi:hypothetical protein
MCRALRMLREHIALVPGTQVEIFFPCIATVIGGKSGLSLRFDKPGLAKAVKGTTKPKRRPAGRLVTPKPKILRLATPEIVSRQAANA